MEGFAKKDDLTGISLMHLEVFSAVVREESYANAALDLQMSRTNVKRVCDEFTKIAGRELFDGHGGENGDLVTSPFGQGVFSRLGPLSTSLRKLEEGVRQLHQAGRVLRFGAAPGFFRGGLFTDYLSRLEVSGKFRSCFMKIEAKDAQKSLLAAECDVYFGIGLGASERLDRVGLGKIGWVLSRTGGGGLPKNPGELKGAWVVVSEGDGETAEGVLEQFRKAGAKGGGTVSGDKADSLATGSVVFTADVISPLGSAGGKWPGYQFNALMRRRHPYADLKELLCAGAGREADGC